VHAFPRTEGTIRSRSEHFDHACGAVSPHDQRPSEVQTIPFDDGMLHGSTDRCSQSPVSRPDVLRNDLPQQVAGSRRIGRRHRTSGRGQRQHERLRIVNRATGDAIQLPHPSFTLRAGQDSAHRFSVLERLAEQHAKVRRPGFAWHKRLVPPQPARRHELFARNHFQGSRPEPWLMRDL
jgi:hypothetical protein